MKAKPIPTSPKHNVEEPRDQSVEAFMRDQESITKPTVVRFSAGFFTLMVFVSVLAGTVASMFIVIGRDQWSWLAQVTGKQTQEQPIIRTVSRKADSPGVPTDTIKTVAPNVVSIYVRRVSVASAAPLLEQLYLPADRRGMGVLLTEDGVGVTTRKAIPDLAKEIAVVTHDQTVFLTKQFYVDPATDLVFFQISARGLPVVDFGMQESLLVGESVITLARQSSTGVPVAGLTTLTTLSHLRITDRADLLFSSDQLVNLIQTKALTEIAGVPVFSTDGKLVGVHTGTDGDAIPVSAIASGLQRIQKTGGVSRNILGVHYIDLALAKGLLLKPALEGSAGAYLASNGATPAVAAKSPAERAGLRAGDIITKVNDQVLTANTSLAAVIQSITARGVANVTYLRDEKEQTIPITLEVAGQ